MDYVGLWIEVPLKPGTRDEVVKAAEFALEQTMQEPGALLYSLNASESDPDRLFLYELYRDQAAMDAHNAAEWLPKYVELLQPHLAGQPTMHVVRPLLGKGI